METTGVQGRADPLVGRLFAGRYRVRRLIARGSMGRVYLAEQAPFDRPIALKVLTLSEQARVDRHSERFVREGAELARLSHENTVRVYDQGTANGLLFIAMEYVDGPTLRAMLADGPLDPLRAVRIALQICGSLGEAHDLGLVHRDLKPANVLVARTPDGDLVKVVDFGLVRAMDDEAAQVTGDGEIVGTPMFMSPEQIRGRDLDQRSDIYALGSLLFRCLTGAYPFPAGQPAQVLMAHLTEPPRTFAAAATPGVTLPEIVEWTVQRCLEKDRDARFVTVHELARALKLCEAALLDEPTTSLTRLQLVHGRMTLSSEASATLSTSSRAATTRRLPWAVGIAVVLAMCMGFGGALGYALAWILVVSLAPPPAFLAIPTAVPRIPPAIAPPPDVPTVAPLAPPPRPRPAPAPQPVSDPEVASTTDDLVDPWASP